MLPRKKPATEIVLPRIPEGVQVGPELLGHIEKLKYSDQNVAYEDKFSELAKRVFLQKKDTNQVGELIDQSYQWETGLEKMGILGLLDLPHFEEASMQQCASNNCKQSHMEGIYGWTSPSPYLLILLRT
jgi:hypothetical protein